MPELHGLTVHVTDAEGNELKEWGTHHMQRHNRVSTYIQSTTDVSFRVSVQPSLPFIDRHHPLSEPEDAQDARQQGDHFESNHHSHHGRQSTRKVGRNDDNISLSSNIRAPILRTPDVPPYSFLASLYLDGRTVPERNLIVYLDPDDQDFTRPNGKILFKHRRVQSSDGTITDYAWVFKERAIETIFNRLMIDGAQPSNDLQGEDAITNAMQSSGLDSERLDDGNSKVGQIVIELRRVRLGTMRPNEKHPTKHREARNDDVDMDGQDITHTTEFVAKNVLPATLIRVVRHSPYKHGEGVYASFQFFYRSYEQLQKFSFPGFAPKNTRKVPADTARALNSVTAFLTPLSMGQAKDKKPKKHEGDSYEQEVKKKSFKDIIPTTGFGMVYRDADNPLQHSKSTAPDSSSLGRETEIPGLTTFAPPKALVDPALTSAAIKAALGSTRENITPSNSTHRDLSATVAALPELIVTGLSPPSSTPLSKENIAKLNLKHKDGFRLMGDRNEHASDAEDEADEERSIKWDVETKAGDSDDYTQNPSNIHAPKPAEEEGFEDLRSKVRDLKIKKRTHADVEDAEEAEANAGVAGSPKASKNEDSYGQKIPTLPLTEEEHAKRSKKVKLSNPAAEDETGGTT